MFLVNESYAMIFNNCVDSFLQFQFPPIFMGRLFSFITFQFANYIISIGQNFNLTPMFRFFKRKKNWYFIIYIYHLSLTSGQDFSTINTLYQFYIINKTLVYMYFLKKFVKEKQRFYLFKIAII